MCLSVCLFVQMPIFQTVCTSVYQFSFLSQCPSVFNSIFQSFYLSPCPCVSLCLSVQTYICLFINPPVHLSVHLSIWPNLFISSTKFFLFLKKKMSEGCDNWVLINPKPTDELNFEIGSKLSDSVFCIVFVLSFRQLRGEWMDRWVKRWTYVEILFWRGLVNQRESERVCVCVRVCAWERERWIHRFTYRLM